MLLIIVTAFCVCNVVDALDMVMGSMIKAFCNYLLMLCFFSLLVLLYKNRTNKNSIMSSSGNLQNLKL